MPIDLSWIDSKEACLKALREADIIHVHHDCINDSEVISILKNKPVIWTLYNLTQSLKILENTFNIEYDKKVRELSNLITVADQSLQRTTFDYITNTTIPLIKMLFNEHTEKNNEIPVVVFAPTNKSNEGVATKKYDSVLKIIEELKQAGYRFEFDLIEGIPYEENLNRKEKADIIIDDVDSNYNKFHNTSIEAACFGAIALTNYTGPDYPFIKTNIYNLKETLIKFITNPTLLKEEQEKIIEWRKNNYTPEILLSSYEKLYYNLLNNETYSNKVKSNLNSPPKTETLQTPKETNSTEENSPLNIKKAVYAFLQEIKSKNINFWLIKDSCLEVLQYKELRTNKLQIGVSSVVEQRIIENLCSGLTFLVEVFVEPNRKTKEWNLYEVCIKVPYPLKTYLERYTGQSWNQLKINE
jgi:hypothetical protein